VTLPADLLASMTVRDHADRVLDLGTGGGVQALLASRHACQVTAVDANPRAAWFVQANAALNGIQNVTPVTGDRVGGVNGDAFDLIVCNPPYAISPDSTYRHRDSGWHGVDLCWTLVRGAAERLNEGGYGLGRHVQLDRTGRRPLARGCQTTRRESTLRRMRHSIRRNRPRLATRSLGIER